MKNCLKCLLLLVSILFTSCTKEEIKKGKPLVLVSIAPYKYFIEKIAGSQFEIMSIVPEGVNSHTYEPSPKDIAHMGRAIIWFRIGDPFEKKLAKKLLEHNPHLDIQDLNATVKLLSYSEDTVGSHHHGLDLHTWLSPDYAAKQSEAIAETCARHFSEHSSVYRKNFHALLEEFSNLDLEIQSILFHLKSRAFLTSHPSFGYFCNKYNLKQISVEIEGKDPRPKDLENILSLARENHVRVMLMQPQFSSKGALLVAKKLDIPAKIVDPYSYEYPKTLLRIAHLVKEPK